MLRGLSVFLAAAALWVLHAPTAHAAAFDPELTWRTLQTEHFNITFHGGEEALAEEVAVTAERVWDKMTAELDSRPKRRTELVLFDPTDRANGYAMTLPVNTIVIYVTAPTEDSTLGLYQDWTDAILTHEFTHILHLDTVEGLPGKLRAVLGRIVNVNRASPGWIIEGQATFQETRHTTGGRGRSTVADMIKRATVLEDKFPPLGNLDGFQHAAPGGNLRYLFGQDFQNYIANEVGRDVWTKWIHGYGGGIPFWLPTKRVLGQRLTTLYKGWRAEMMERYRRQETEITRLGLTPTTLVTNGTDTCMGPEFSPDGEKLVYACSDPVEGASIWVQERDEEAEEEIDGAFARNFAWRSDGKAFFYSSSHTVDRFNLYDDIWFHKLGKESSELITRGKRARHPTVSPDGRDLVVVRNKVQQNQLARFTADQRLVYLTDFSDHTQLSTPRFSPDGRFLALSLWRDGIRDIWVFRPDGTPYRRVTQDPALDADPVWSADGRWLYFSSDRSGVFNLYAVELETEALYQITNLLGGAFHPMPHPDATHIVFEQYSLNGTDIALMPLARDNWRSLGSLPLPMEHRAVLADTIAEDRVAIPIPQHPTLPTPEEETATSTSLLPSGIAKRADMGPYPGLQGWGGPMQGWKTLPAFSNPWLDSPEVEADTEGEIETDKDTEEEEDFPFTYPVKRYSPLGVLFPPRYWRPLAMLTYDGGFMAYAGTSSWDTLLRYMYSGFLSYRSDNQYIGWGTAIAINRWIPVFSGGAYSYTARYGSIYHLVDPPSEGGSHIASIETTGVTYWDKRTKGYLQMAYPLDANRSLYLGWSGTQRTPLVPLEQIESQGVNIYRSALPTRGFFSTISGGWRYAKGSTYGRAVSVEKGRSVGVTAKITSALLGSYRLSDTDTPEAFSQTQVSGEWREYLRVPWFDDHVIATKLAGGGSVGDQTRYGSYRLGGNFGEGGMYSLPDEYRSLRGFNPGAAYGDWYYKTSIEYRAPVWYIDRGVGTIPFFARYISATAFLDAGYAFGELPSGSDSDPIFRRTLVGTGAELRGTSILAYGGSASARLGYAFALTGGGIPLGSLDGLYIRFDTSF